MMSLTPPILTFAAAYTLLAVLPGPNFLVVAKASLSPRGHAGLLAAMGIACGAGLLALGSAVLAARLDASPALAAAGHVAFAVLLATIGLRALRPVAAPAGAGVGALLPAAADMDRGAGMAGSAVFFILGFATAAANPVSAAFFGSYLVSSQGGAGPLPPSQAAVAVFLVAAVWFGAVGATLSVPPLRRRFERHRRGLDRIVGVAFTAAGAAVLFRLLAAG